MNSAPTALLSSPPSCHADMSDTQWAEFEKRCKSLGHRCEEAGQEHGVCTYFTVPTLDDCRPFLGSTKAQRNQRAVSFFNPGIAVRKRLGQGLHDRGEASVFAGGALSEDDRPALAEHLPLHAKAISFVEKVIPAGQTWDVSVRGEHWGLDDMEELYVFLNVGTLVIEPGATWISWRHSLAQSCVKRQISKC